jgi:hypothetical protein
MVGSPTTLSLGAFVLKLRFPLKNAKQNAQISAGIGKHLLGVPAACR